MKKANKRKGKRLILVIILLSIALLALIFLLVRGIKNLMPIYKSEERTENIKNYKVTDADAEVAAWLRVQGTNIDYPVIDNNYRVGVDRIEPDFTWTQGTISPLPNKLFILGHNIKNVSSNPLITAKDHTRFEQLLSFVYYDFIKENKYIQYTIDGTDYLYKIFSVAFVDDSTLDYESTNYSKEEMKKYINQSKKDSFFDFDIDVNENDKIISLITCTRFFGSTRKYDFKIDARMVRKKERATNYSVEKNKNYSKIEKIMRGENNEQQA